MHRYPKLYERYRYRVWILQELPIAVCFQFLFVLFPRFPLSREEAVQVIVDSLKDPDVVFSTTGKLSRELFEYREAKGQGHQNDFLTVGSMGHTSAIALGVAKFRPNRQVTKFLVSDVYKLITL